MKSSIRGVQTTTTIGKKEEIDLVQTPIITEKEKEEEAIVREETLHSRLTKKIC